MAGSADREARGSLLAAGRVLGGLALFFLPVPIAMLVDAIFPSHFIAMGWVPYILIVSTSVIGVVQVAALLAGRHVRRLWTVLPLFAPITCIGLLAGATGSAWDRETSLATVVAETVVFVAFQVAWAVFSVRDARKSEHGPAIMARRTD